MLQSFSFFFKTETQLKLDDSELSELTEFKNKFETGLGKNARIDYQRDAKVQWSCYSNMLIWNQTDFK